MRSKIILCFTILLTFLLQSTLINKIAIGSITPNLPVILCISMGLMRGRKSGLWVGFFSGLLVDIFYGSFLGFYALIYMYLGFFSGYAYRICYDDEIKVPVMLAGIGDLIYSLAVYALQFLLRGRLSLGTYLIRIILPEAFYTVCLTFLLYRFFYFINYHLMEPVRPERESVWVLR